MPHADATGKPASRRTRSAYGAEEGRTPGNVRVRRGEADADIQQVQAALAHGLRPGRSTRSSVSSSRPSYSITPKRAVSGRCSATPRARPPASPAGSGCGFEDRRHTRRCAGWRAPRRSSAPDSHGRSAVPAIRSRRRSARLRGGDEIGLDARDIVQRHRLRHLRQAAAEGDGRWRDGVPAARIVVGDVVVAFPRAVGAGLAAGVADLDARHRAGGLDATRRSAPSPAACSSFQMPVQPGVMRPSGDTAVASTITSPAPPRARPA